MYKGICFDLFWTLVKPVFQSPAEYEALDLSKEAFEKVYEEPSFCAWRNLGNTFDKYEIGQKIAPCFEKHYSPIQIKTMIDRRSERLRLGMHNVDPVILKTLGTLKERGFELCLVSNADCMDKEYWNESPLSSLFENVVFSCDVKCIKPDRGIYDIALEKTGLRADQCLFTGDGGHDELKGAKSAGFTTVFTEYLLKKNEAVRSHILPYADFTIGDFEQLLQIAEN